MNRYDTELDAIFARQHLRLTAPRRAVFDILKQASEPLLASAIIKQCPTADKVSVYRTLELFSKLQIVTTVPLGWKMRYELTGPFKKHHHHLHCTACGALIDVHSEGVEQLVAQLADAYKFTPHDHQFEITGLCHRCS